MVFITGTSHVKSGDVNRQGNRCLGSPGAGGRRDALAGSLDSSVFKLRSPGHLEVSGTRGDVCGEGAA